MFDTSVHAAHADYMRAHINKRNEDDIETTMEDKSR